MKLERTVRLFSSMPELETERLILRRLCRDDGDDMYEYAQRTDVTCFLLWSPHPTPSYTREYLAYVEKRYESGSFYDWAVVIKDTGRMIGTCGFARIDHKSDTAEIGYVINPRYAGRGIATEAAEAVVSFGFERLGLHRIEARFMKGNEASLRVMEKLGMTFEGYMRDSMLVKGAYRTIGICSVLKSEFFDRERRD